MRYSFKCWVNRPMYGESNTVLDSGFQVLDQWNLDSGFQSLVGFRILWAVFRYSPYLGRGEGWGSLWSVPFKTGSTGAFHSTQNSGKFGWYIKWNRQFRFGATGIFGISFEGSPLRPIWSFWLVGPKFPFHLFGFPNWKSLDPKIIGIKTYLFENFSQVTFLG